MGENVTNKCYPLKDLSFILQQSFANQLPCVVLGSIGGWRAETELVYFSLCTGSRSSKGE